MRFSVAKLSLGAALMLLATASSYAAEGSAIFKKSCSSCHYTDGPAKEKSIADQLAKKGPELWYAGSKFQKVWLVAWLQNPKPIRPLKYNSLNEINPGNHPKLSAGDAATMAEYLMSFTSPEVKAGMLKARASAKGRRIFVKDMPCGGCHGFEIRGELHGGKSGPSLIGASNRLNPDWIYAYMLNVKAFKTVTNMPDFSKALNQSDLEEVSAYIATF